MFPVGAPSSDEPDIPVPDKTDLYRAEVLERAGFEPHLADIVARRHDIDLHEAVELVKGGCPSVLAVRILI